MDLLVTYDVNTLTPEGRSRLRRVARVCQGYGQRVQESVFECTVNEAQKALFVSKLRKVVNETEDSLRIYQLRGGREGAVECFGIDKYVDFSAPLVL